MIYSNTDILNAIATRNIQIKPFNSEQLQINSYDLCLGNTFFKVFWDNEGPFFVGPYVYMDGDEVHIPIGGTLLGVTKEHVSTSGKVVAELRSRSTTRRTGITTNCDAGLGDIGYSNYWTLELTAFISTHYKCVDCLPFLRVGQKIAQMIFSESKSEPVNLYDGQYQSEWPFNMVPAEYRHRIETPKNKPGE